MGQKKADTIWFHLYEECKQNKTKQKQAHPYRCQADDCQRGEEWGKEKTFWKFLKRAINLKSANLNLNVNCCYFLAE